MFKFGFFEFKKKKKRKSEIFNAEIATVLYEFVDTILKLSTQVTLIKFDIENIGIIKNSDWFGENCRTIHRTVYFIANFITLKFLHKIVHKICGKIWGPIFFASESSKNKLLIEDTIKNGWSQEKVN